MKTINSVGPLGHAPSRSQGWLRLSTVMALLVMLPGGLTEGKAEESTPPTATVKPLWVTTAAKLLASLQGDYSLSCQGSDPNGNFLFRAESTQGPIFILVDPKTGKPIKRIATVPNPKQTVEWTAQARFLPDGRFLDVGVRRGLLEDEKEYPQGKVQVGVNLRVIDTVTGTIVERLIPFDDPSGEGMSTKPCWWTGQVCAKSKAWKDNLYLSNQHFIAELNADSLQTERSLVRPEIKAALVTDELGPLQNGCAWFVQGVDGKAGEAGWKFILGEFGKEPREISRDDYGRMTKELKIEEIAHPKIGQMEFVAREDGAKKELLQRDGSKLAITHRGPKTVIVDLGAANTDGKAVVERCGEYYFISVYLKDKDGVGRQRGLIVVTEPKG